MDWKNFLQSNYIKGFVQEPNMTYNLSYLTKLPYVFQTWCRAVEILMSSIFFEQMTFEQMTHLCFLIFYSRVQTNVHTFRQVYIDGRKTTNKNEYVSIEEAKETKENIDFFFLLWPQSADNLTIHSVPCSWILWANCSSNSTLSFAGLHHM